MNLDEEMAEEAKRTIFSPEFLRLVQAAKAEHPMMFVSGWDDEEGVEPTPDIENDVNARMLWAAENGRLDIVQELVQKNPSLIHVRDNDGYTPLHRASYNEHEEIVQVLGRRQLGPFHNNLGIPSQVIIWLAKASCLGHLTPLHLAVSCENGLGYQVVQLLLSQPNINRDIVSKAGETAYDVARQTSEQLMNLFVDDKDVSMAE